MESSATGNIFKRIEFWIFLLFLIRLVSITAPPLETGHSWRQVTGLMVARNFLEVDANLMHPRIDDHNGGTGIIGMEFPSLNYAHFLVAKAFGYTHWYGRLINLIITSLGLWCFAQIVRRFFNSKIALASTLFLATSIWFSFGRKMMPDTYCIALMLIAIHFGVRYLDRGNIFFLASYLVLSSLAMLSKIPAGIYFSLSILLLRTSIFPYSRRMVIVFLSIVPIAVSIWWYFSWNPHLAETYGYWYNSGASLSRGIASVQQNLGVVFNAFSFNAFNGYVSFGIALIGLILLIRERKLSLILPIFLLMAFFIVYMVKSGEYFIKHNYYIIPIVPALALAAGYAMNKVHKKWIFISILTIGMTESVLNQQHDFRIKDSQKYKLNLEPIMDDISSPNDLIVINGASNPQQMYFAHRKGWSCDSERLKNTDFIESIRASGCKYAVVNIKEQDVSIRYEKAFEDEHYRIFDLGKPLVAQSSPR